MRKNIKIILSKAPSFGDSVHKYALWWRKCRPFYAVWMSSRRYSHANYYRQFVAEQLSDNVRNGGGLLPHSPILLLNLLLTTFSLALLFICDFSSPGRENAQFRNGWWGWCEALMVLSDPGDPSLVQEFPVCVAPLQVVGVHTIPASLFRPGNGFRRGSLSQSVVVSTVNNSYAQ